MLRLKLSFLFLIVAASSAVIWAQTEAQIESDEVKRVGTHISCLLKEHGDELELHAESEISNIDDEPVREKYGVSDPVIRQIKISGSTVVVPGKTIAIGSADDPTSNRRFELEVTVTKLR